MPPPISLRLTKRQRGLLSLIESGVASRLSSRSINEAIRRGTGEGMNRQVLLDVIREIKGIRKHGDTLKNVRKDRHPDITKVRTALTPISHTLSSTIEVRGFLTTTGESIIRHVQVVHDTPLTVGEIEAIGANFIEEEGSEYGITLDRVLLVEQVKRA